MKSRVPIRWVLALAIVSGLGIAEGFANHRHEQRVARLRAESARVRSVDFVARGPSRSLVELSVRAR
jgi:hypothetical protein